MASLDWRLAKLFSLRAVEGRVHRRRYEPFNESDMHRLSKQGVPDRLIMATSGNKSFESTKIDRRRTPSTTVDGCLPGRRPLCGRQKKKTCHQLNSLFLVQFFHQSHASERKQNKNAVRKQKRINAYHNIVIICTEYILGLTSRLNSSST